MLLAMTTRVIEREVKKLRREVGILRAGLMSVVGEDSEGTYRPEFVEEILKASGETPSVSFKGTTAFRKALRGR